MGSHYKDSPYSVVLDPSTDTSLQYSSPFMPERPLLVSPWALTVLPTLSHPLEFLP